MLADAWRPRGVRALTRPGACAADGRGAREQGTGAEAGRAGLSGWAESEAQGPFKEKCSFSNYFQFLFHSNKFLNFFKAVSKVGVKMKVVPFFKIYNFAFMTKVKFQIDFELPN